jgi:predicted nucleic acid-binding protein
MTSLIDTNIIVDYLRGHPRAVELIREEFRAKQIPYASVISYVEICAGARPREEEAILTLFDDMRIVEIGMEIAGKAGAYLNIYGKSHGLEIADALIAATAFVLGLRLVTLNRRHFPMIDVQIYIPY